ncbi:MAG: GSCFA domain-containing protein [Saprospiraceae bacterium]|nr:GSCFA domain-containing protein [Saprospiraceae bacterium]
MDFRTILNIGPSDNKIDHGCKFLLIGSCFSQNIGLRLKHNKFDCLVNPFGTIFNPVSIAKVITRACKNDKINLNDLIVSQDIYVHSEYHSQLSDVNPEVTSYKINEAIGQTYEYLSDTNIIFITLGTSTAYRSLLTGEIVANCHKIPAASFKKVDISIEESFYILKEMISEVKLLNPKIRVIFTISPVRHTKDGIIQNSRSKAKLVETICRLQDSDESIEYFPAFEWMMDDLRDYRFYEKDLIHPNEIAIDYLWEKFCHHFFDPETIIINKKIENLMHSIHHRPLNPASENHRAFINQLIHEIENLKLLHSFIHFDEELAELSATLKVDKD